MVVQETARKEPEREKPLERQVKKSGYPERVLRNKWFIRVVVFAVLIASWEATPLFVNKLFTSSPSDVVMAFFDMLSGTGTYALIPATLLTLEQTLTAFVLGVVFGLAVGISMGMVRTVDTIMDPYVTALYVTPRIALIPLIIIWLGTGFSAITFVGFLLCFFPVVINTYSGIRNISRSMLDTAQVFGVKGIRRFRKVVFPATIPFFMSGVRLGLGQAFVGIIVAQMLLSLAGLGYMLVAFGDYFDTAQLYVLIIELMVLGLIFTFGVQYVEKRLTYWKQTERAF
jgi:ABC-type nitrate/sulfonate/bicarbonate transport system permease component